MGSAQSFLPAAVFVAGAVVYGYTQLQKPVAVPQPAPSSSSAPPAASSKKQKSKKKAAAQGADASALTEQEKADSARASAVRWTSFSSLARRAGSGAMRSNTFCATSA